MSLCALINLIFPTTPQSKYYHYSYFTENKGIKKLRDMPNYRAGVQTQTVCI